MLDSNQGWPKSSNVHLPLELRARDSQDPAPTIEANA